MHWLSGEVWSAGSSAERLQWSQELLKHLPDGFSFHGLASSTHPANPVEMAIYRMGMSKFIFIPGALVELGFDTESWEPTTAEVEDWRSTVEEYGASDNLPVEIKDYVRLMTLPRRTGIIPPLVVERSPFAPGWQPVSPEHPDAIALWQKAVQAGVSQAQQGELRITRLNGGFRSEKYTRLNHAELSDQFLQEGYRLPTSDEWEYLYGAARITLFTGTNHVLPDDTSGSLTEENVRVHRWHNPFYLNIGSDIEVVNEAGVLRGDGGAMGGLERGVFIDALLYAPAYFDNRRWRYEITQQIPQGAQARRLVDLSAAVS